MGIKVKVKCFSIKNNTFLADIGTSNQPFPIFPILIRLIVFPTIRIPLIPQFHSSYIRSKLINQQSEKRVIIFEQSAFILVL